MASRYDRLTPIDKFELARVGPDGLVDLINDRLNEVNRVLAEIAVAEAKTRGTDGFTPTFITHVDVTNNRITNVAPSKLPNDVVTRQELMDLGLIGNPNGSISFNKPVEFKSGASSTGSSGENSVVTLDQVSNLINIILGNEVATSVSGSRISTEDAAGANGSTQGTLAMGRSGDGKADFVQLRNGELVVSDPDVRTLLLMLIEEVRGLKNALSN